MGKLNSTEHETRDLGSVLPHTYRKWAITADKVAQKGHSLPHKKLDSPIHPSLEIIEVMKNPEGSLAPCSWLFICCTQTPFKIPIAEPFNLGSINTNRFDNNKVYLIVLEWVACFVLPVVKWKRLEENLHVSHIFLCVLGVETIINLCIFRQWCSL